MTTAARSLLADCDQAVAEFTDDFKGRDQHELIAEAINWWKAQPDAIDSAAAPDESRR
jgi:hypothetical protein